MSQFNRPSLPNQISAFQQQIAAPLNLAFGGTSLRRSVTGILATVQAMALQAAFAYEDWLADQFFVDTASGTYLDRKGEPIGVPRKQGGYASATVTFTGIPGILVPAGTVLANADASQSYALAAAVTLVASGSTGSVQGTVVAITPGSAATPVANQTLVLVSAVPGVVAQATVSGTGIIPGVDVEPDPAYRNRVLARLQEPPQGGADTDWQGWTKSQPGVTRAWVYPLLFGAGTVGVAPVYDGRAPGSILPLSGDIASLTASVGVLAPVIGSFTIFALAEDAIPVTIQGLTPAPGYTLSQAQAAANAALAALFAATTPGGAAWGDGVVQTASGPIAGKIFLKDISDAIDQAPGVGTFDLASPSADIVSATGHLATFSGAATFT